MRYRTAQLLRMDTPSESIPGKLFTHGATVPTDATAGYAAGCIFQDTTNGTLYLNEGTYASCDFNVVAGVGDDLVVDSVTVEGTGTYGVNISGAVTNGIAVSAATAYAVDISTSGVFRMGVQGTGIPVSTTYPFGMEVQTKSSADITPGATGFSCGVYSRYEVGADQTTQCSHAAVLGKFRVKKDLADGVHAAVYGYVEESESGTVIGGTATTQTAAGFFAVETDTNFTLSTGYLCGVSIDSSMHDSATYSGTVIGLRINKSSGKKTWPVGIKLEDSSCTTGVELGDATTALLVSGDTTTAVSVTGAATTGVSVSGATTTGLALSGTATNGIVLSGTYSGAAISGTGTFNSHFMQVAGSADFGANKAIYIGAWGSEAEYEDDGGLFRIYGKAQSGGSTSAQMFTRTLTDSTSSVIGFQLYADSDAGTPGPTNVEALNCFAVLNAGKYLAASTSWMNGLKGAWLKVQGDATSVCSGNVAPLWVDNQMSCTVSGEEYGIIATTGGTRPDAFIGFETSSSGYDQLLYFDETFNSGAGTCVETSAAPGTQDARIKVYYDGTQYYLALYK